MTGTNNVTLSLNKRTSVFRLDRRDSIMGKMEDKMKEFDGKKYYDGTHALHRRALLG